MTSGSFAGDGYHPALARAITTARQARLDADFAYLKPIDPHDFDAHKEFLGECHLNVLYLSEALAAAGFKPYIRWGALNQPGESSPPETVHGLESDGFAHFWAEVTVDGDVWNLDLATEIPGDPGRPLLSPSLPDVYHRPEKSLLTWDASVTSKHLRNIEGYNSLVQRGYLA